MLESSRSIVTRDVVLEFEHMIGDQAMKTNTEIVENVDQILPVQILFNAHHLTIDGTYGTFTDLNNHGSDVEGAERNLQVNIRERRNHFLV